MRAGEPVSEGYLGGREAVQLIAGRPDSTRTTMESYRTGAFMARQGPIRRAGRHAVGGRGKAPATVLAKNTYHQQQGRTDRPIDPEILPPFDSGPRTLVAGRNGRRSYAMRRSA